MFDRFYFYSIQLYSPGNLYYHYTISITRVQFDGRQAMESWNLLLQRVDIVK